MSNGNDETNGGEGAELSATPCSVPIAGRLYKCETPHGTRTLRWGYHRKHNDRNWSDPGTKPGFRHHPTMVWIGWRDHETYRFLRPEEVKSFREITPNDKDQTRSP